MTTNQIAQYIFIVLQLIQTNVYPELFGANGTRTSYRTNLYGQTCNSHDIILEEITFPDANVGDLIKFNEFGAYSEILGGNFNGFLLPYYVYYVSADAYNYLSKLQRWPRIKALLDSKPFVYGERPIVSAFKNARVI